MVAYRRWRVFGIASLLCLAACSAGSDSGLQPQDTTEPDDVFVGKADTETHLSYNNISSKAAFEALAFESGGTVTLGRSVKFLIDYRKPSSPLLRFLNANYTLKPGEDPRSIQYHYFFAKAVLKSFGDDLQTFNDSTYFSNKRYFAGTVQEYRVGKEGEVLYGIQFYPEDTVSEKELLAGVKIVRSKFKIPDARIAFVSTGPQQTTASVGDALSKLPVENLTLDQVLGSVTYMAMNPGEAWGYLRIFPTDPNSLTPLDLPVFNELPLDLAVVAGTITRAVQDASSHVNLKSKERNTANMVLRDAAPDNPILKPLADKPVHLVVRADSFTIESSTAAEVEKKYAERTNKPWIPLVSEPETKLLSFAEMCPSAPADCLPLAARYGSKAVNLGFLTNANVLGRTSDSDSLSKKVGYDLVPVGIGIPIQYYHDFVAYAPNKSLRDKLQALIEAEKEGKLSPADRSAKVQEVQDLFYSSQFPPGVIDQIKAKITSAMPGVTSFKVRSSANAEDLPNFDGAGLYDSFSAKLKAEDNPDGSCQVTRGTTVETKLEVVPKTVACAIKGAYASTWNLRAISERSFARLDHATAGMGIAINSKYDAEAEVAANSVVVTRVIGSAGVAGYTLANQQGNNLVTNPLPGTVAESVMAAFSGVFEKRTFMIVRYATPTANQPPSTKPVYTEEQMNTLVDLVAHVEEMYCRSKNGYYDGSCDRSVIDPEKPSALDLEFKFLENGHFVAKQVREFAGK